MSKYLPEGWTQDKIDETLEFQRKRKENKMSELSLSETEQKLFDFIKNNEDVTIKLIELQLGAIYVGALGRLIGNDLVKSEKRNLEVKTNEDKYLNKYGKKFVKCYFVNEEKK